MEYFLDNYLSILVSRQIGQVARSTQNAMTHNLALEVMRRCNYSKSGVISQRDFIEWIGYGSFASRGQNQYSTNPSFDIMRDLIEGNSDYLQRYG